ncbi:uncharacterized protein [Branchiostoma lanceolatum]|uniref:uncharacterized protein n=1 Tax=Branchiostoma lanceolatum TaxID=7740 RepID=UPI0034571C66
MQGVRGKASGGDSASLMQAELRLHPREELQRMLHELHLDQVRIPTGHLLAAKVDIGMNWSQCRDLRRWLKKYNVGVESEARSRKVAADLLSEIEVKAENLPFSVKGAGKEHGTVELLPCAYVTSLQDAIHDNLERCKTSNSLTWHGGKIPRDEIWIKVGGDHGGGSFKFTFQVLNKESPNSKKKTTVICVFNAKDNRENLQLAISRYAQEIKVLQDSKWRCKDGEDFKIRIFAAGDYALLCLWYGLSGACACYPCLWCDITKEEMADPDDRRIRMPQRTLETLQTYHNLFVAEGQGKIKLAKKYHNVISPVMFAVPVDQVVVPGLHVSLGIYVKLFKLLENELHDMDLKLQSYLDSVLDEGDVTKEALLTDPHMGKFKAWVDAIDQARELDEKADALEDKIEEQEDQLAWLAFEEETDDEDDDEDNQLQAIFNDASEMIEGMVQKMESFRTKAVKLREKSSVKMGQGPLTSELDDVLKEFRVERQAYHSKSFIGNHVNTMLKDEAICKLTGRVETTIGAIIQKYEDMPVCLVPQSTRTARKYRELFLLFAKCHRAYSQAGPMDQPAINELAQSIKDFMAAYRRNVPNGTIPMKFHMMEDHIVPCIRKWGFGLGFMAEQGIEQVHSLFNSLATSINSIPDPVARIKSLLKTHLIGVSPDHVGGVPKPVARKKNT